MPSRVSFSYQPIVDALNAKSADQALLMLAEHSEQLVDDPQFWDYQVAALLMAERNTEVKTAYQACAALNSLYSETVFNAIKAAERTGDMEWLEELSAQLEECGEEHQVAAARYRADALWKQKKYPQSLVACRALLELTPDSVAALRMLIKNLLNLAQVEEAVIESNRAVQLLPDNAELVLMRFQALIAYGAVERGFELTNAWCNDNPDLVHPALASALANFSQYHSKLTVAEKRSVCERFGQLASSYAQPTQSWLTSFDAEKRLHIGLLSGDLRSHPVGYFMEALLEHSPQYDIVVTVFDTLNEGDDFTTHLRSLVDQWHNVVDLTNQQIARLIQSNHIDILIDLHGHTTGQRLGVCAFRPAPLQLTWHGFLGTTGVHEIDYAFADPLCAPQGSEQEFIEDLLYIPCYYCFKPIAIAPPVAPPPAIKNGFITFGSLNKPDKHNQDVLSLWAKVLDSVPNSRLLLKGKGFDLPIYRLEFERKLLLCGFDLARVELQAPSPRELFLQSYQDIDIALDPFPYSGATTTVEALWCGVPVLAISGDRMVWRMADSILTHAGHPEWVAENHEEFVKLAVELASDTERLVQLRNNQRENLLCSPLFDSSGYAENVHDALSIAWRKRCASGEE